MPRVVAVTGFLGASCDFDGVRSACPKDWSWRVLTPLDLGGGSISSMATQLQSISADLRIGYSMGGRVLLAAQDGTPTLALSAGTGLHGADARAHRAQIDDVRAEELRQDPPTFLKAWYQQPLFDALRSSPGWEDIKARRCGVVQQSEAWAAVLADERETAAAPIVLLRNQSAKHGSGTGDDRERPATAAGGRRATRKRGRGSGGRSPASSTASTFRSSTSEGMLRISTQCLGRRQPTPYTQGGS